MKIARIAKACVPSISAHSIHIMKMCEAFRANENNVVLITSSAPRNISDYGDLFEYYGVESKFDIIRLGKPRVANGWRFWSWRAIQIAQSERADIIYTCMLEVAAMAALSGTPVIYEEHKSPAYWVPPSPPGRLKGWRKRAHFWLNRLFDWRADGCPGLAEYRAVAASSGFASQATMFDLVLDNANVKKIVCITHSIAQEIYPRLPASASNNKVLVAPNGAKVPHTSALRIRSDSEHLVVGYCGSLSPNKGMALIERLAEVLPDLRFHILGGSTDEILSWRQRLHNLQNIRFLGYAPPSKVDQHINDFDLCLLPNGDSGLKKGLDSLGQYKYT